MSEYFAEPKSFGGRVKVELDLSNYAIKADSKNAAGVDTSKFAKKVDLASLKSNIDELDIDKLKNVPTNLNNLQIKVNKLGVDKLVPIPVDVRKLSHLVKYDVVKKDVCNAKVKNTEDKIPAITNLVTNITLNPNQGGEGAWLYFQFPDFWSIPDKRKYEEDCHNSRTTDDIDMKLGPVTKHEKESNDDVMLKNCDVILVFRFMASLEQSGS